MREETVDGRTASETYRWHRKFVCFFLGGATFMLIDAAAEAFTGSGYTTYMFVGGALASAGFPWGESRRQKNAEREYDGRG